MAGIKVSSIFDTYDFVDVGSRIDYKIVSRADGKHCGWIRKSCIPKDRARKPRK